MGLDGNNINVYSFVVRRTLSTKSPHQFVIADLCIMTVKYKNELHYKCFKRGGGVGYNFYSRQSLSTMNILEYYDYLQTTMNILEKFCVDNFLQKHFMNMLLLLMYI